MVSPNKIIGILNNNVLGLDIGSAAVLAVLSALGQDFNLELTSAADDPFTACVRQQNRDSTTEHLLRSS